MGPAAIAGITAAGNLLSNLVTNRGALRRQQRADRQNIAFWNMQNKYNHPAQQMERLKAAGLNPNLIYGSSVAGATGSAGSIAPSKAAPYAINNPALAGMSAFQTSVQAKNLEAQTLKTLSEGRISKGSEQSLMEINAQKAEQMKAQTITDRATANVANATEKARIAKVTADLVLAQENGNIAEITKKIKQLDQQVKVKGFNSDSVGYILSNVFGMDMRNSADRTKMQVLLGSLGLSQIFKNVFGSVGIGNIFKKPSQKNINIKNQTQNFNK